ncbi:MAG: [protein-PII] uridylyltransferase, partial [Alphaproteobacteria bacterium]
KVGHATRTVDDCVRLSKTDVTISTAMLEARPLWGDKELNTEFHDRYWAEVVMKGDGTDYVEAKLAERDMRHNRMGDSRYVVEPNLKDGKGGLRDLQTLYWIGKWVYGTDQVKALVEKGVFTSLEARRFARAARFFMTVRCHLHYITGRPDERITFDLQPELATRMGYTDRGKMRAVERFMKHYFLMAKHVGDLTRIFCAVLEDESHKARPATFGSMLPRLGRSMARGLARSKQIDGFVAQGGRLALANESMLEDDPVNLLRLFLVADENGLDVHPDSLRIVTRSLHLIDKDFRKNPEANETFLAILCSKHDPENALRRLNESGVFGKFMPEFGRIVAQMQFNMYHHYTVDEHTIQAIGILARIERGELREEHETSSDVIHKVVSRQVLFMAMLLHDIAKGRPQDHSELGARIAKRLCPRMGMTEAQTDTVAWLVRNHLVMSNVAQKRDISDPKTVETFANVVQTPERLRLLLCLTVADIRATAPGVWNAWKGQLLRDLYIATMERLSGGHQAMALTQRADRARAELKAALTDWSDELADIHVGRFADAYFLTSDLDAQVRHAKLMALATEELTIDARVDQLRAATEVTVLVVDHPGIFSRVAGALTLAGAQIVDCKAFTTQDGQALETFWVQDSERTAFDEGPRIERLKKRVSEALKGDVVLGDVFDERGRVAKKVRPFKVAPNVVIDNNASDAYSVIEVYGLDRLGLLHELARVLFAMNLTIGSAHISTFGEVAVDVFYVKDLFGHKIRHEGRIEQVEQALLDALARTDKTKGRAA